MKLKRIILISFLVSLAICTSLFSTEFTVASFNCGGLSDHYDYLRAVTMHKLIQERYNAEPLAMAQLEKIQQVALKILFSPNQEERQAAELDWKDHDYAKLLKVITLDPYAPKSINKMWNDKSNNMITNYKERPVVIYDAEVQAILQSHMKDITNGQEISLGEESPMNEWLDITRRVMAKRIFQHELKYDIIALQEADYLDAAIFQDNYDVRFSDSSHSVNGIAWNKEKFALVEVINSREGRGLALKLKDLQSGKTVVIASAHLTGCNPFHARIDSASGMADSAAGDHELLAIIDLLENVQAETKIIAMDSNVTATHPRLSLLKKAGYTLDYTQYLDPTCTNPHQVLNTRIDWIAVKSVDNSLKIHNIPVLGIGLNSPQTNISDHKPIASLLRDAP